MRIESGTTGERRTRNIIALAMWGAFSLWFAYDGWVAYPRENIEWARQAIPIQGELHPDPSLTIDKFKTIKPGSSLEEVQALGRPIVTEPARWTYYGNDVVVNVEFEDGKVSRVTQGKPSTADTQRGYSPLVRAEVAERVKPGMTPREVEDTLGRMEKPHQRREPVLWFLGPAAYAKVELDNGRVSDSYNPVQADHKESDILIQKALAIILAVASVLVAINLLRVLRTRVVLDDAGLEYDGKRVPFDTMIRLDTADYLNKGWLDLVYSDAGREKRLRLDSWNIDKFKEIVGGICEQKGWEKPFRKKDDEVTVPAAETTTESEN